MTPFRLDKWYLDCVTETGDAAIVYAAEMHWRSLSVGYCGVLLRRDGNLVANATMRGCAMPCCSEGQIDLKCGSLALEGGWRADSAPVARTVYECANRGVHWECLQPRSIAQVRVGDFEFSGLGYAERLTVTLPPWQLPMRELRWGRFVSTEDTVTWVDWKGPYATSFAVHNGEICTPEAVSESRIALPGIALDLEESVTLRDGDLRTSILPNAPALATLLPKSLFGIYEYKWLSRGQCRAADHASKGWTIHEVVKWNT